MRGVTNLHSQRCGVAQRLLHANERLQTISVNDGSSRPDSRVLLAVCTSGSYKLLRIIGLTRGFDETGPWKSLEDAAKCTFLHMSVQKWRQAPHSMTPHTRQQELGNNLLGLGTVPVWSGAKSWKHSFNKLAVTWDERNHCRCLPTFSPSAKWGYCYCKTSVK